MAKFKRILLKLSGESLMGEQGYGIDVKRLNEYAAQIKDVAAMGVQIGIVIGGGGRALSRLLSPTPRGGRNAPQQRAESRRTARGRRLRN